MKRNTSKFKNSNFGLRFEEREMVKPREALMDAGATEDINNSVVDVTSQRNIQHDKIVYASLRSEVTKNRKCSIGQ